jgi:hypothetical protein
MKPFRTEIKWTIVKRLIRKVKIKRIWKMPENG